MADRDLRSDTPIARSMRSPIRQAGILLGIYVAMYLTIAALVQVFADPTLMAAMAATSESAVPKGCAAEPEAGNSSSAARVTQWVGD